MSFNKWGNDDDERITLRNPKLMLNYERMVHQGLGWFLRGAWKKDRKVTERFLLKWKDEAPRKIYQYATEKMTSEQKKRFKKGKKS